MAAHPKAREPAVANRLVDQTAANRKQRCGVLRSQQRDVKRGPRKLACARPLQRVGCVDHGAATGHPRRHTENKRGDPSSSPAQTTRRAVGGGRAASPALPRPPARKAPRGRDDGARRVCRSYGRNRGRKYGRAVHTPPTTYAGVLGPPAVQAKRSQGEGGVWTTKLVTDQEEKARSSREIRSMVKTVHGELRQTTNVGAREENETEAGARRRR